MTIIANAAIAVLLFAAGFYVGSTVTFSKLKKMVFEALGNLPGKDSDNGGN